ncbi:MAG: hypothetical protein ABI759_24175 [Candidatus Solibacter sp.]
MPTLTPEILNAAIEGFESQKRRIDDQISALRAMLPATSAATPEAAPKTRKVSAAVRRRMALGQQKRWAAIKGPAQAPSASVEPTKPKRTLSAAGKAAIVAAVKKRWAAKKAAAKTAPVVTKKAVAKKTAKKKAAKAPAA